MKKQNTKDLSWRGVITEIITPWKSDGTFDQLSLERLVDFQNCSGKRKRR